MKKKFLNTKNVVIGLVSLVLIGASATGVTIFLKDRGEAAAAEQKQVQNLPATGREENNNQTDENTTIPSENNTTGDNTQIPTEPSTTEGATPSETTRPGTTGTTRPRTEEAVAGIEETVRIEERKVFEDLKLSWTTLAIPAITADMGIFKPVLGIEKTATAVVRANQEEQIPVTENNLPIVRVGDTIIYTIKVSNSGNYKATNVVVTDSLDVIFDGQTVKANEELAKIETLDAGKQATLKVGYVVTQEDIEAVEAVETADGILEVQKNIENKAYATDGKTTVEDEDKTVPVNPDVTIKVNKTWNDNENQDGIRPDEITINLFRNRENEPIQTQKIQAGNKWEYEFKNLPKYDEDKNEIFYYVMENEVEGYEPEYKETEGNIEIQNTHTPATTSITGSKTWDDAENQDGKRPASITIRLLADGTEVDSKTVTANDNWSWTFADKPVYANGTEIEYTITEDAVAEYDSNVRGYNVTNTHTPATTSITGSKTWIDEGIASKRPASITIRLLADGTEVDSKTVTANDNWSWTFANKPVYANGTEIEYTIAEDAVAEYGSNVSEYNVTNTIAQDYVSLSGSKIWIDPVGTEHDTITLQVYQNNEPYKVNGVNYSIELADRTTTFSFTGLPKYKVDSEGNYVLVNGKVQLNEYKVVETTGQTGYSVSYSTVTPDNNGNYTQNVTNSLEQTEISFIANKVWVDEGVADNRKNITVELYKNDVATGITKTINKGQTSCTFENLERYTIVLDEYGEVTSFTENRYEVREKDITGYTPSYSEVTKSGTTWSQTITNTIAQTTTTVTVNKVWDTAKDITKPTITINLYKNDESEPCRTVELTSGKTTHTFTNLPKYKTDANGNLVVENGKVVLNTYRAEEVVMPEYTTTYSDDTLTVTNTAKGIVKVTSHSTTATQNTVPVDVVLVLDVSGSMLEYNSSDVNDNPQSKAEDMVSAVNSAIASIRSKNPENRVSVVAFSSTSKNTKTQVLLPLGKYTAKSSGQYLIYSDDNDWDWEYTDYYHGNWQYTGVESAAISTNVNGKDTVTVSVTGGTYTQTGIYEGAKQLLGATVTYDKDGEGTEYEPVTRIPIMMLLTDGLPTYASTTWNGKPTDSANADGKHDGSNTSSDEAYYTIRTAHYYKGEIGKHYNNTEAKFYTIGFGVSSSDKLANAILNPTADNITACNSEDSTEKEKRLYNKIIKNGKTAGAYSYADGSYLGNMDTETLTNIMNSFINANAKVTTERVMTEAELTSKIVELTDIDTAKEFEISYGTTKYNFEEAKTAGLIKPNDEVGPYYVDLSGIDTTEQIVIKYNTKTVEQ